MRFRPTAPEALTPNVAGPRSLMGPCKACLAAAVKLVVRLRSSLAPPPRAADGGVSVTTAAAMADVTRLPVSLAPTVKSPIGAAAVPKVEEPAGPSRAVGEL